jgi:hypothetical protein
MPTPKEAFERLLSTTLKMDADAVAALYTDADRETLADDATDKVLAKYTEHIESVRSSAVADKEEQFKFGERKAHKEWRETVKALGVKSDKKDPKDVLAELLALKGTAEVTEDAVKLSPVYRNLETEFVKLKDGVDQTIQEKLAAKDAEHQRDRILSQVGQEAETFVLGRKPILSKDPLKAKNQLRPFIEEVKGFSYQVEDNGGNRAFLLIDQSGKRLEDKLGHPLKYTDKWNEIADKYFDFEQSTERSTAGDPDKGTNKAITVELPKDPNERADFLFKVQRDPTIPKEKVNEILKAAAAMT